MNIKKTATSVKNHVHRNRGKYAAAATFTGMAAYHIRVIAPQWNDFLDEHDLRDAYYAQED